MRGSNRFLMNSPPRNRSIPSCESSISRRFVPSLNIFHVARNPIDVILRKQPRPIEHKPTRRINPRDRLELKRGKSDRQFNLFRTVSQQFDDLIAASEEQMSSDKNMIDQLLPYSRRFSKEAGYFARFFPQPKPESVESSILSQYSSEIVSEDSNELIESFPKFTAHESPKKVKIEVPVLPEIKKEEEEDDEYSLQDENDVIPSKNANLELNDNKSKPNNEIGIIQNQSNDNKPLEIKESKDSIENMNLLFPDKGNSKDKNKQNNSTKKDQKKTTTKKGDDDKAKQLMKAKKQTKSKAKIAKTLAELQSTQKPKESVARHVLGLKLLPKKSKSKSKNSKSAIKEKKQAVNKKTRDRNLNLTQPPPNKEITNIENTSVDPEGISNLTNSQIQPKNRNSSDKILAQLQEIIKSANLENNNEEFIDYNTRNIIIPQYNSKSTVHYQNSDFQVNHIDNSRIRGNLDNEINIRLNLMKSVIQDQDSININIPKISIRKSNLTPKDRFDDRTTKIPIISPEEQKIEPQISNPVINQDLAISSTEKSITTPRYTNPVDSNIKSSIVSNFGFQSQQQNDFELPNHFISSDFNKQFVFEIENEFENPKYSTNDENNNIIEPNSTHPIYNEEIHNIRDDTCNDFNNFQVIQELLADPPILDILEEIIDLDEDTDLNDLMTFISEQLRLRYEFDKEMQITTNFLPNVSNFDIRTPEGYFDHNGNHEINEVNATFPNFKINNEEIHELSYDHNNFGVNDTSTFDVQSVGPNFSKLFNNSNDLDSESQQAIFIATNDQSEAFNPKQNIKFNETIIKNVQSFPFSQKIADFHINEGLKPIRLSPQEANEVKDKTQTTSISINEDETEIFDQIQNINFHVEKFDAKSDMNKNSNDNKIDMYDFGVHVMKCIQSNEDNFNEFFITEKFDEMVDKFANFKPLSYENDEEFDDYGLSKQEIESAVTDFVTYFEPNEEEIKDKFAENLFEKEFDRFMIDFPCENLFEQQMQSIANERVKELKVVTRFIPRMIALEDEDERMIIKNSNSLKLPSKESDEFDTNMQIIAVNDETFLDNYNPPTATYFVYRDILRNNENIDHSNFNKFGESKTNNPNNAIIMGSLDSEAYIDNIHYEHNNEFDFRSNLNSEKNQNFDHQIDGNISQDAFVDRYCYGKNQELDSRNNIKDQYFAQQTNDLPIYKRFAGVQSEDVFIDNLHYDHNSEFDIRNANKDFIQQMNDQTSLANQRNINRLVSEDGFIDKLRYDHNSEFQLKNDDKSELIVSKDFVHNLNDNGKDKLIVSKEFLHNRNDETSSTNNACPSRLVSEDGFIDKLDYAHNQEFKLRNKDFLQQMDELSKNDKNKKFAGNNTEDGFIDSFYYGHNQEFELPSNNVNDQMLNNKNKFNEKTNDQMLSNRNEFNENINGQMLSNRNEFNENINGQMLSNRRIFAVSNSEDAFIDKLAKKSKEIVVKFDEDLTDKCERCNFSMLSNPQMMNISASNKMRRSSDVSLNGGNYSPSESYNQNQNELTNLNLKVPVNFLQNNKFGFTKNTMKDKHVTKFAEHQMNNQQNSETINGVNDQYSNKLMSANQISQSEINDKFTNQLLNQETNNQMNNSFGNNNDSMQDRYITKFINNESNNQQNPNLKSQNKSMKDKFTAKFMTREFANQYNQDVIDYENSMNEKYSPNILAKLRARTINSLSNDFKESYNTPGSAARMQMVQEIHSDSADIRDNTSIILASNNDIVCDLGCNLNRMSSVHDSRNQTLKLGSSKVNVFVSNNSQNQQNEMIDFCRLKPEEVIVIKEIPSRRNSKSKGRISSRNIDFSDYADEDEFIGMENADLEQQCLHDNCLINFGSSSNNSDFNNMQRTLLKDQNEIIDPSCSKFILNRSSNGISSNSSTRSNNQLNLLDAESGAIDKYCNESLAAYHDRYMMSSINGRFTKQQTIIDKNNRKLSSQTDVSNYNYVNGRLIEPESFIDPLSLTPSSTFIAYSDEFFIDPIAANQLLSLQINEASDSDFTNERRNELTNSNNGINSTISRINDKFTKTCYETNSNTITSLIDNLMKNPVIFDMKQNQISLFEEQNTELAQHSSKINKSFSSFVANAAQLENEIGYNDQMNERGFICTNTEAVTNVPQQIISSQQLNIVIPSSNDNYQIQDNEHTRIVDNTASIQFSYNSNFFTEHTDAKLNNSSMNTSDLRMKNHDNHDLYNLESFNNIQVRETILNNNSFQSDSDLRFTKENSMIRADSSMNMLKKAVNFGIEDFSQSEMNGGLMNSMNFAYYSSENEENNHFKRIQNNTNFNYKYDAVEFQDWCEIKPEIPEIYIKNNGKYKEIDEYSDDEALQVEERSPSKPSGYLTDPKKDDRHVKFADDVSPKKKNFWENIQETPKKTQKAAPPLLLDGEKVSSPKRTPPKLRTRASKVSAPPLKAKKSPKAPPKLEVPPFVASPVIKERITPKLKVPKPPKIKAQELSQSPYNNLSPIEKTTEDFKEHKYPVMNLKFGAKNDVTFDATFYEKEIENNEAYVESKQHLNQSNAELLDQLQDININTDIDEHTETKFDFSDSLTKSMLSEENIRLENVSTPMKSPLKANKSKTINTSNYTEFDQNSISYKTFYSSMAMPMTNRNDSVNSLIKLIIPKVKSLDTPRKISDYVLETAREFMTTNLCPVTKEKITTMSVYSFEVISPTTKKPVTATITFNGEFICESTKIKLSEVQIQQKKNYISIGQQKFSLATKLKTDEIYRELMFIRSDSPDFIIQKIFKLLSSSSTLEECLISPDLILSTSILSSPNVDTEICLSVFDILCSNNRMNYFTRTLVCFEISTVPEPFSSTNQTTLCLVNLLKTFDVVEEISNSKDDNEVIDILMQAPQGFIHIMRSVFIISNIIYRDPAKSIVNVIRLISLVSSRKMSTFNYRYERLINKWLSLNIVLKKSQSTAQSIRNITDFMLHNSDQIFAAVLQHTDERRENHPLVFSVYQNIRHILTNKHSIHFPYIPFI